MDTLCIGPGEPRAASFKLPRGACDCHLHVLGPFDKYPLAQERPYTPPPSTLADLEKMMNVTGIDRVVIAHVSAQGFDMSVTLDAMTVLNKNADRARGVAMVQRSISDAELESLNAAGMRGVRLSGAYGSNTPIDEENLEFWATRIARFGWHIAMWPSSLDELRLLERLSHTLGVPLVLDHLASHGWYVDGQALPEGIALIDRMLATGNVWMKISGMYRASRESYPWADVATVMQRWISLRPDRFVWASDWPFVGLYDQDPPRLDQLMDWLTYLGLDEHTRQKVLVTNPELLYGFQN